MINFGNIDISEAHLGDIELDSMWLGSIKVWPDGTPPAPTGYTFSVSPTALTTDADNKTVYFTVTTDSPQWTVSSTDNWVTVMGVTGGTVEINIATNYGSIDRQGSLIFSYEESSTGGTGTITVGITQEMPIVYTFGVSPSSITLASESSYCILTASGTTPHWEVNYYSDWITIDGITGSTIQASVSSNTGDTRQGGITFIYVDKSIGTVDSFTVDFTQEAVPVVGNVITYVSINDSIVVPKNPTGFNANIVSNTYYPDDDYGEIVFDDNVTEIKGAFAHCTGLTEMIIPDTVTVIGVTSGQPVSTADGIFYGCTNLQKVVLSSNLVTLGRYSFAWCPLTSITLPDTLVEIGQQCFSQSTGLTQIVIPNSVTTMYQSVFSKCTSLSSVTLSESLTELPYYTFSGCTSLTSINIPNSVSIINGSAFRGCSSLSSVTIGSGVTSIGQYAFASCSSLYEFNYNGTKSQWSNITKNSNWKASCPATVVHCTDGDVSI